MIKNERQTLKPNIRLQFFIHSQISSSIHYTIQVPVSEDIEYYEDALNNHTMSKEIKDIQRKKLRTITFTSEVFQTLVDDETTVYLSNPVSLTTSGPVKGKNTTKSFNIKNDKIIQQLESHIIFNVSKFMLYEYLNSALCNAWYQLILLL